MKDKIRKLTKESTLCNNNLQVKFYLNSIKKILKKLGITDEFLSELINDALETLRIMKKQGQKLEDRCRLYRSHIESCGFVRKKKRDARKSKEK